MQKRIISKPRNEEAWRIIDNFVAERKLNYVQGTDEWKEYRKTSVGASELASIMGINKYQSRESTLQKKLCPPQEQFSVECTWGNIMEPVAMQIIEDYFKTRVVYSSVTLRTDIPGHHDSPDGFCVINGDIVLIEIKNPYRRKPLGTIPMYYYPQVQTGIYLDSHINYALFVDCCIRARKDNGELVLFNDRETQDDEVDGRYSGIVYFCTAADPKLRSGCSDETQEPVNLAEGTIEEMNKYFLAYYEKRLVARYSPLNTKNKEFSGKDVVAYLPWVLKDYKFIRSYRDYSTFDAISDAVSEFRESLSSIRQQSLDQTQ